MDDGIGLDVGRVGGAECLHVVEAQGVVEPVRARTRVEGTGVDAAGGVGLSFGVRGSKQQREEETAHGSRLPGSGPYACRRRRQHSPSSGSTTAAPVDPPNPQVPPQA